MKTNHKPKLLLAALTIAPVLLLGGCADMMGKSSDGAAASANTQTVTLSGTQMSPPVTTSAGGTGTITVDPATKAVTAKLTTTGITGTAAHIHEGAPGTAGPVVVPLTQGPAGTWASAPGAKLTDAQYDSYKAGKLYFNVHSAANPQGELRGQIKP